MKFNPRQEIFLLIIFFVILTMDLPQEIKTQLQKLLQKQQFLESVQEFVKVCLSLIYNSEEGLNYEDEEVCPTALLMALSHFVCEGKSLLGLATMFPEAYQQRFMKACQKYTPDQPNKFQQMRELRDVKWEMFIVMGRQLWQIALFFSDGSKLKFVLNYEQLAVLVFKLGQIVNYVPTIKI